MPMKPTIFILCFILFTCYKNSNARDHNIPDVKTFTFKEAGGVLEDTVFFKSKKIIPLETNDLALIGQIDRICMAEDTLFVLDQQSNSVIVYDKDGKYINRIRNVGKGPKEYINIGDISVDNLNKELVVLCAHPSKVQFYSYQGKFLREESLGERYYSHLGTDGRYIYFHDNTNVNKKKEVAVYDRQLNHKADVLEHGKVFENNELGTVTLLVMGIL